MTELDKVRTDEAVQGRVRSFTTGHLFFGTLNRGVGQGNFVNAQFKYNGYHKAPHSTYVQTGAELGTTGMFLFLLVMWCNFRTLLFATTHTVEQERVRRLLFVLALTFMISGWMVDFAYRATFFMFSAAIAAFHRNLYGLAKESIITKEEKESESMPAWRARLLPQPAPAGLPDSVSMEMVPAAPARKVPATATVKPWLSRQQEQPTDEDPEQAPPPARFWNKISLLDLGITFFLLKLTDYVWVTIILRMSE